MFYYARSDTHYLLYIYDVIRNELLKVSDRTDPQTDYIEQVLRKSKELSLSRYEGANYNTETGHGSRGWYGLLLKNPLPLSGPEFAVYRAIWKWRDDTARSLDESTFYVMPNNTIVDIARNMPPDAKALHSMIPNNSFIAKRNVNDIWAAYQAAKEAGANGPTLYEYFRDDPAVANDKRTQKKVMRHAPAVLDSADSPRLEGCQLFGDVSLSATWASREAKPANDNVLLPWQRLTGASTVVDVAEVEMPDETPQAPAPAPKAKAPEELPEEEFTLKGNQKRKAPVEDTSSEEESDEDDDANDTSGVAEDASEPEEEIEMEDEEEKAEREKAARKLAKRNAKAARKAAQKARAAEAGESLDDTPSKQSVSDPEFADVDKAEKKRRKEIKKQRREAKAAKKAAREAAEAEAPEPEEAFDYSKASSVMHASRNGGGGAGNRKKFDPYKKLENEGIKGARKAPPLHGGRSATFRK